MAVLHYPGHYEATKFVGVLNLGCTESSTESKRPECNVQAAFQMTNSNDCWYLQQLERCVSFSRGCSSTLGWQVSRVQAGYQASPLSQHSLHTQRQWPWPGGRRLSKQERGRVSKEGKAVQTQWCRGGRGCSNKPAFLPVLIHHIGFPHEMEQ